MDVGVLVVQPGSSFAGDGDYRQVLHAFLDLLHFGHVDFEAELHDVGGEHEDNEQHEDHVDQRDDVDFGQRAGAAETAAASAVERISSAQCECHGARYPSMLFSVRFMNSSWKSSMRAPNSLIELPNQL